MSKKTIYRTVIQFTVLSEEPIGDCGMDTVLQQCEDGDWIGSQTTVVQDEKISGLVAVASIMGAGSEPEFFQMDSEGNDLDDDLTADDYTSMAFKAKHQRRDYTTDTVKDHHDLYHISLRSDVESGVMTDVIITPEGKVSCSPDTWSITVEDDGDTYLYESKLEYDQDVKILGL